MVIREKEKLRHAIVYKKVSELKTNPNHPWVFSEEYYQKYAKLEEEYGQIIPIVVDKNNLVIYGNERLEAARLNKTEYVSTICIDHLTEAQKKAWAVAEGQLQQGAVLDLDKLKVTVLEILGEEPEFDFGNTFIEIPKIDLIINGEVVAEENDPLDESPELDDKKIVTKLGDVWILGDHILVCGDALKEASYKTLLESGVAHMVFTDPPYNVKIDGHVCGNGKIKHKEFAMAAGEMDRPQFVKFLGGSMALMAKYSKNGSIHFVCMDWRHASEILAAGTENYSELKNICVWNKNNGGMGSLYRSKHEFVFVYKNGKAPHTNNVELVKHGRNRTNVWDYAGVNGFGGNQQDLEMHPTVKPVAMIADAIMDCSNMGEIILDPFGGSGSTLIAAERTKRKAKLIELEPKYCDVIIKRWQAMTGKDAVHKQSGRTFSQLYEAINN